MLFRKKKYLAVLDIYKQFKVEEFDDPVKAKEWLDENINYLKRSYPHWPWHEKWQIIPFVSKKVIKA